MQDVMSRNVSARNNAQKYNLDNKQNISNANVDTANKQEMHNKSLIQQQYDNQAKRAAGLSGQYGNMSQAYGQNADRTAGQFAGAGSAIGEGLTSYAKYLADQKKKKTEF
jgi:hypothetical protein